MEVNVNITDTAAYSVSQKKLLGISIPVLHYYILPDNQIISDIIGCV